MHPEGFALTRRAFLERTIGTASALATFGLPTPASSAPTGASSTLAAAAAARGLLFGSCSRGLLPQSPGEPQVAGAIDPAYSELFLSQCRLLTTELEMKMMPLRPGPGRWNWAPAQALADYAARHDLQFRGHCLLWGESTPAWIKGYLDKDNAEAFVIDHITRVCSHFAGHMHSWDVVNEAFYVGNGGVDGMRRTVFLETLGERYLEIAFRAAHAADPHTLLSLNDYGIEYDHPINEKKRQAMLLRLRRLVDRGVPIHAVGIQSHLAADEYKFSPDVLLRFFSQIAAMGLQIFITELDVPDYDLSADVTRRDRRVAEELRNYLDAALSVPAVTTVVSWGLSDRYSWLNTAGPPFRRPDGLPSRSHFFDSELRPKPLYAEALAAFNRAPLRKP
jgi:endo-1,4-beta-xylanase